MVDILVFSPHPDDAELCVGGILIKAKKSSKTGVVDLTEGEMGTYGNRRLRLKESNVASKILGLSYRANLNLGDTKIEPSYDNSLICAKYIRELKPKVVLLPLGGIHPDHNSSSLLIERAIFYSGLKKVELGVPTHRPTLVLYYPMEEISHLEFVVDITDVYEKRLSAIMAYSSQFEKREEFLSYIESRTRFFGSLIGVKYGEALIAKSPIMLSDVMELCK
jgi:bacillithiol biosynthesis deacetylase BshB1